MDIRFPESVTEKPYRPKPYQQGASERSLDSYPRYSIGDIKADLYDTAERHGIQLTNGTEEPIS